MNNCGDCGVTNIFSRLEKQHDSCKRQCCHEDHTTETKTVSRLERVEIETFQQGVLAAGLDSWKLSGGVVEERAWSEKCNQLSKMEHSQNLLALFLSALMQPVQEINERPIYS